MITENSVIKQKKVKKNKALTKGYVLSSLKSFSNSENINSNFLDPHKFVTFKYSDIYPFSLATVTGTNQVMNLNSIYDPDRTGTGHQPYGFDSLAALYARYRVWAVKWKVTFHAGSLAYFAAVLPSNGALATAVTNQQSFTLACESPRSVAISQSQGANSTIVEGSLNLNDLNGTTIQEYMADDRFQGTTSGSGPSEVILLNIPSYNNNGTTVTFDIMIELEYLCELHDPFMLAQS